MHLFSVSKDDNADMFGMRAKATFALAHAFTEANHRLVASQAAIHTLILGWWGRFPFFTESSRHLVRDLLLNWCNVISRGERQSSHSYLWH